MKAPTQTQITLGLFIVAGLGLLYAAKKASGAVSSVTDAAAKAGAWAVQTVEQAQGDLSSLVGNNIIGPWQRGQDFNNGVAPFVSSKAFLYSDANYTGNDVASGLPIMAGEWANNPDALRYEQAQRERGATPGYTSTNGAAFGFYIAPKARKTEIKNLSNQLKNPSDLGVYL